MCIANLVLQDTMERIYVGNCYGDIPRGIFLIRGENVVLLGEIVSFFLYTYTFWETYKDGNRIWRGKNISI